MYVIIPLTEPIELAKELYMCVLQYCVLCILCKSNSCVNYSNSYSYSDNIHW